MSSWHGTIQLFSCVGGGPMERLVRAWNEQGVAARLCAGFSPARWRRLMAGGATGRLRARLGAMLLYPLRALAEAIVRRPRVLIPTTNPSFLPVLLLAARPLHRRAVVPLVYDLYPDALEAAGLIRSESLGSRLARAANRFLFKGADGVVFIGDRMGAHARERYGAPRTWTVLETGAESREFSAPDPDRPQAETELERWCEGRVVLGYVGNLGRVHDWETLAAAVPLLLSGSSGNIGVVIAASGPGVDSLREAWSGLVGSGAVRFDAPLEDRAWVRLLQRIEISIVTLRPEARHTSIPSKTFSAMAAGSAIVAIAPRDSDVADLVERHGCGVVLEPGRPRDAARAIAGLIADAPRRTAMRAAARQAVAERYDMPQLAARWTDFLGEMDRAARRSRGTAVKRALDVIGSSLGLLFLSPVLLAAAIAVRASMGAPVLFRQERPGRGGRPFRLLKFRTMRVARPGEEGPDADGARLTRVGAFLRSTSIDELPTLLNVLRGEMSLVGPRPLLMRYLPRYSAHQARRHEVNPGITGWAQVNGRNAISWEQKFDLDVWYVDHRSLVLDLRILLVTVLKVLRREGISRGGHATMPEFMGGGPAAGGDPGQC